jgi:hypothetical protein
MDMCGLEDWVYGAWHMWAQSGHMTWHMMTLDIQTRTRGGSCLRVDRRGRQSSKGDGL